MCDPISALTAGAGAVLNIAGGALKSEGALAGAAAKAQDYVANAQFAQLQAQAFGQQSDVATSNLELLKTQAQAVRENVSIAEAKGRLDESRIADVGDKTERAQVVRYAYSNIDPSFGSPLVLAAKTAGDVATDINLTRAATGIAKAQALTQVANVEQQAFGVAENAVTSRQNALLSLQRVTTFSKDVDSAATAGRIGAGAAMLSGFAGAAGDLARLAPRNISIPTSG